MSAYPKDQIRLLIEDLVSKCGEDLSYTGLIYTARAIHKEMKDRYLYEKFEEIKREDITVVSIQRPKLDSMLKYLGFETFEEFLDAKANPIEEVLRSCAGTWLSYVRQNSTNGVLYQSPVRIFEQKGKMIFSLGGPHQSYVGELTYNDGTVYIIFKAENGKQFQHVYRVGKRMHPNVLKGLFSGVSTAGNPIGGRTVLIRDDRPIEELTNSQFAISDLLTSTNRQQVSLGKYFEHYADNNLSIGRVDTFEIADLV